MLQMKIEPEQTLEMNIPEQNGISLSIDATVLKVPIYNTTFVFTQAVAAADWYIEHNLNKYPSITVVDSAGTWVRGGAEYINANTIVLHFSAPFAGTAYLN